MEIFVFISQHYIWFIIAAILIILAIIGYYADTTNFGLGKAIEEEKKEQKIDIENLRLQDVSRAKQIDYVQNNSNQINNYVSEQNILGSEVLPSTLVSQTTLPEKKEEIINFDGVELNQYTDNVSYNIETHVSKQEENKENLLNDEVFNKFNEEFDMLLPRKQTITDDLLADISDIDLGKTQKFDFNSFTSFENIELPKIKDFDQEPDDIWKL